MDREVEPADRKRRRSSTDLKKSSSTKDALATKSPVTSDPATTDHVNLDVAARRQLRDGLKRSGLSAKMFIDLHPALAAGLTPRDLNRWMRGLVKTVPRQKFAAIHELLANLADGGKPLAYGRHIAKPGRRFLYPGSTWLPMDQSRRRYLRDEMMRTGLCLPDLMRFDAPAPAGLTRCIASGLVSGHSKTVNAEYWDYLVKQLSSIQDKPPVVSEPPAFGAPRYTLPDNRPISAEDREALVALHHRTGVSGQKLLQGATDKPAGLDGTMISAWRRGVTRSALPEHVAYVLARYRTVAAAM